MIGSQFILGLAAELVIDLFAGGGGASTGIEQAIGRHVDIAVNHDAKAVALHQANHPQTKHFVADVFEVDPMTVAEGRPVGLLWASPDCKHFSKAKGGKPVSKKIRSLANVVIDWAKLPHPRRPRVIFLENVEEFKTWGPLLDNDMPDPARRGETFLEWKGQLEALGYVVEHRELRACDYGAPTIRKRLFLVARCDGEPIVWPAVTHAAKPVKGSGLLPYRTAAECIDWSLPCPSIFERERELAPATLRRIAHGIKRYVIDSAKPYIVPVTHPGDARVHSVDEPFRTITGANRGELALSTPTITRIGQTGHGDGGKSRRADEPLSTVTSKAEHLVVKSDLVAAFLAKHYTGVVGRDLVEPIATVTSVDHHSLVSAHVTKFRSGSTGSALDEPLHTVTAGGEQARPGTGNAMGIVTAQLVGCGGRAGQSRPRDASEPLQTITAKGDTCLMSSVLVGAGGPEFSGKPKAFDEPMGTLTTENHRAEVRALLLKYYSTDQDPNLREPLHTVTTKDRFGLVTVKGEDYHIADIGMRMLQPRELYRAQGFADTYIIDHGADGRPLSKADQVRMCGNSVCPPLAAAIVRANYTAAADVRKAA